MGNVNSNLGNQTASSSGGLVLSNPLAVKFPNTGINTFIVNDPENFLQSTISIVVYNNGSNALITSYNSTSKTESSYYLHFPSNSYVDQIGFKCYQANNASLLFSSSTTHRSAVYILNNDISDKATVSSDDNLHITPCNPTSFVNNPTIYYMNKSTCSCGNGTV